MVSAVKGHMSRKTLALVTLHRTSKSEPGPRSRMCLGGPLRVQHVSKGRQLGEDTVDDRNPT